MNKKIGLVVSILVLAGLACNISTVAPNLPSPGDVGCPSPVGGGPTPISCGEVPAGSG